MIFNKDWQLRQLFSSCAKSKPCHQEWLGHPQTLWQLGVLDPVTQWHWGLFCLLLKPQLWCWKWHFWNASRGCFGSLCLCLCFSFMLLTGLGITVLKGHHSLSLHSWFPVYRPQKSHSAFQLMHCLYLYLCLWSLVLLRAFPNISMEIILLNLSLSFSAIPCCWDFIASMAQTILQHSGSCWFLQDLWDLQCQLWCALRLHHLPTKIHRCLFHSGHSSELLPQVGKAPLSSFNFLMLKCLKAWSAHLCTYSGLKLLWCSCINSPF